MSKIKFLLIGSLMLLIALLAGCASSSAASPAGAVAAYWQALVAKDEAQVSSLSCAAYESEALTTLESFSAVKTELKDLSCKVDTQNGDTAAVSCTGSIVATYGEENMVIDLTQRNYAAKKESGDWRMCGAQ